MAPARRCHHAVTSGLVAELQLDRLKQRGHRRVLLLRGQQAAWQREVTLEPGMAPQCHQLAAYLRVWRGDTGVGWRR